MNAAKTLRMPERRPASWKARQIAWRTETEALKGAARREDLHIWQMEKTKTSKKGRRHKATGWPHGEGDKVRNVHI
jgi:hypothetical protein